MNKGFVRIVECFYNLFDSNTHIPEDEDFKHYHKKDLMAWMETYAKMFDNDLAPKPVTLIVENQKDFDTALAKIMKVTHTSDPDELVVENGPRYILNIPFFDNIHGSLTKKKGSELLPVFSKIEGKFSFEINVVNTGELLCKGEGENGKFSFIITDRNIQLPKTLDDLPQFGYDLQLLMEISTDLDFIYSNIGFNTIE